MNTKSYFLMHKNDIVSTILIDSDTGYIESISHDTKNDLMPFGTENKEKLNKWWKRRAVPNTRKGIPSALNILDKKNTGSLLLDNLGLSLTDHYWVKPVCSDYTWDSINLFTNNFTDVLGEFQFTNNKELLDIRGKTTFIPSASLQGELQKKWLINSNKEIYLVKGNYGGNCQQSLNECFASQIHKKQGFHEYTNYVLTELTVENGTSLGCSCKNFVNEKTEFISAYDINTDGKKPNDLSEYEYFIRQCVRYGLDEYYVRNFMEYQLLTDFLLTNTDRHFNNFGIIRNSETLKFEKLAPIFDTGNSMFWNVQGFPDTFDLLDVSVSSFLTKEISMLKYVKHKNNIDINKLPDKQEFYKLYKNDLNISEYRIDKLYSLYERKIIYLDKFQHDKSLKEMQRNGLGKISVSVETLVEDISKEEHRMPAEGDKNPTVTKADNISMNLTKCTENIISNIIPEHSDIDYEYE